MTNLKFLHGYLYHSGESREVLSPVEHDRAMALCDGYGGFTISELKSLGLDWDWSHVRDSSERALSTARAYVERVLAVYS